MVASVATGSKFAYRPEIDGVRALAVVAVIINHFNKEILPSGYLGVDVFFVLSGFVITLSIASRASQKFSDFLTGFYTRRIKRLVPALLLFVAINSVLICLFNPDPRDSLETGISALFGFSNLYLLKESTDYFAASTELNVFTHTWSLGVEEQFYLLFPWVVWVTFVFWASLLTFVHFYPIREATAYFLMPTRLWELGAGCLLFLMLSRSPAPLQKLKNAPPLLIALALVGVLFVPRQFAIFTTIAIVTLTAILIVCIKPKTTAYKLFAHPKLTYLGRLSYSLYLWHWSVLSISRWTIGIHWWSLPFQIALIFLLAAASYHYVESPLRHLGWASLRWQVIGKAIAVSLALALAMTLAIRFPQLSIYAGQRPSIEATGVASLTEEYLLDSEEAVQNSEWQGYKCVLWGDSRVDKAILTENCTLGDFANAERRVLVLGDSFSSAFTQSFDELVVADNYSVTLVSAFGTSPVKAIPTKETTEAINNYYWDTVVPNLIGQLKPDDWVLLINNLGSLAKKEPSLENGTKLQQLEREFSRLSDRLAGKDVRLAVLHGLPFASEPNCPPAIAAKQWFSLFGGPCKFPSRKESLRQRESLDAVLSGLEAQGKLKTIGLFDIYCPNKQCTYNATNGHMLYRDEYGHPSVESARLSAPIIRKALTSSRTDASLD